MKRVVVALVIASSLGATRLATAQPATRLDTPDVPTGPVEDQPPIIDLVTFGVGDLIFEKFGHAALCLRYHDPRHQPVCFNYGVTNFNEGAIMIWNFLRTKQKFWVEPMPLGQMAAFYRFEDRDIWLQTLPITGDAARGIETKLWSDIKEENRYYYYDHFFDNCTTRLRDMIDVATGGKLREGSEEPYPLTFRELGARGMAVYPPMIAAADFVMGRQLDDHPTIWESMFHPDLFRAVVEAKLGVKPRLLYKRRGPPFETSGSSWRLQMFAISALFALPLLLANWRRKLVKPALIWSTIWLALWGILIWTLVLISSIRGVRWNEAVFVMVPFDIVLPFLGEARRRRYALVRVAMLVLASLLCAVGIFHQPLWIPILTAFMPMAILAFDLPHGLMVKLGKPAAAKPAAGSNKSKRK